MKEKLFKQSATILVEQFPEIVFDKKQETSVRSKPITSAVYGRRSIFQSKFAKNGYRSRFPFCALLYQ